MCVQINPSFSSFPSVESAFPQIDFRKICDELEAMFRAVLFLIFGSAIFVTGCNKSPQPAPSAKSVQHTNEQIFQVKGVVIAVKPQEKSITIKHEDIPDYMPGMTMPFDVKDTNELAGISAGDPVTFRLLVTDTEGWIDQIRKTGPKTNVLPANAPIRRARDVEPLNEGDVLPEYQFTNQFGKMFSTRDFKGQALAIEFLFTRCPLPNFCPFLANNFAEAQKQLLAMPNAPTNWHLLTISFDPEFDTPTVLKNYAAAHGADPAHWTFATGDKTEIYAIAEQFGVLISRDENGGFSHNLRAAVIDTNGRVRKIFIGNEWKPEELTQEILKATR
jgi:protein SCO1/2